MLRYNLIMIAGNVTKDTEIRYTAGGSAVMNFGIAYNESFTNNLGLKTDKAHFYDCVMFGKLAEKLSQMIKKGDGGLVAGKLKQETWTDKNTGQERSKHVIYVDTFNFTTSNANKSELTFVEENIPEPAPRPQQQQQPAVNDRASSRPAGRPDLKFEPDDEDIPF